MPERLECFLINKIKYIIHRALMFIFMILAIFSLRALVGSRRSPSLLSEYNAPLWLYVVVFIVFLMIICLLIVIANAKFYLTKVTFSSKKGIEVHSKSPISYSNNEIEDPQLLFEYFLNISQTRLLKFTSQNQPIELLLQLESIESQQVLTKIMSSFIKK